MPVPELPGHPHPRLLPGELPGRTAGTPPWTLVPRPTVPRSAQRSARARPSEIPVPFGMVSKGRAKALPLVVSRGSRGEIRNPPGNLSWEAREDILLIRKEYPLASRRPSSAAPHARQGGNLRRHAESSCPTGYPTHFPSRPVGGTPPRPKGAHPPSPGRG